MKDPNYTDWCRYLFLSMTEGGVWGVPRSGLIFERRGDALVLIDRLPWEEGMPLTAEELTNFQEEDFQVIKFEFARAGIEVKKG